MTTHHRTCDPFAVDGSPNDLYREAVADEALRLMREGEDRTDALAVAFGLVDPRDHGCIVLSDEPTNVEREDVASRLSALIRPEVEERARMTCIVDGVRFAWAGGEYIDVNGTDVVNVWDYSSGTPSIPRTLDAFEARCVAYVAEVA